MKKPILFLLCACLLFCFAAAEGSETTISLSDAEIHVNGAPISADESSPIYLALRTETHEDVPNELKDVQNRVITITEAGSYRFSGSATDAQIAVKAGKDDQVRIILDGASISCRTAPAIAVFSAYDSRIAEEYGVTIELAEGSVNSINGSHTCDSGKDDVEFDGAIGSQVSLGFEGNGALDIIADNEGVEVSSGHMTFNGGVYHISACDDPLNVSEDGFGVLTVNNGYLYSNVDPERGSEGDGIDSNGWIVFNGGTVINLAHPSSGDSGIDSDMGSSINGGVIVGAGNMYDPIDAESEQLFMMLEFAESTDDLLVVTDEANVPVFAYDFPSDYMYIAFSTPELEEGSYHVYLGGEIDGEQTDGLYTSIRSYTPGRRMQHGEGNAQRMPGGAVPQQMGGAAEMRGQHPMAMPENVDLNKILKDADLNELLKGKDLNGLITGFSLKDILSEEQIREYFGGNAPDFSGMKAGFGGEFGRGAGGVFGGPRGLQSSSDVATTEFNLSFGNTGFTNVRSAE